MNDKGLQSFTKNLLSIPFRKLKGSTLKTLRKICDVWLMSLWLMLLCSGWLLTCSVKSALLMPLFIFWHLLCRVWCSQSDSPCRNLNQLGECLLDVFSISRIFLTFILNNKSLTCFAILSTFCFRRGFRRVPLTREILIT